MYQKTYSKRQLRRLEWAGIKIEDFDQCFNTVDTENINEKSGFLSDVTFNRALLTYKRIKRLNTVFLLPQKIGPKLKIEVKFEIEQVHRTEKTHKRLKGLGLNPSPTSQHKRSEAGDIHVFVLSVDGLKPKWVRITADKTVYCYTADGEFIPISGAELFNAISEYFSSDNIRFAHEIVQFRLYDWGFHVGFESSVVDVTPSFTDVRKFK